MPCHLFPFFSFKKSKMFLVDTKTEKKVNQRKITWANVFSQSTAIFAVTAATIFQYTVNVPLHRNP
jgi:hypothetical protein